MSLTATFFGHSCWLIEADEHSVIIDPYISENHLAPIGVNDVPPVQYILVTHAHSDHLGDTVKLARKNNALVISTFELAGLLGQEGLRTHGMHLGGSHQFAFGTVTVFQAFHGSGVAGGHAAGFIVRAGGHVVYHAGDTALFSDMKFLDGVVVDHVDLALLPIGSNFTMGIDDAVVATGWINPDVVIPMHYNTFSAIAADPELFRARVEESTGARAVVLKPGENLRLS